MVMPSTPTNRQNVSGAADGFVDALQSFERIELRNPRLMERAVELGDRYLAPSSVPLNTTWPITPVSQIIPAVIRVSLARFFKVLSG